jgi:translation initiation factor IF-2
MSNMRVYELAKEFNKETKEVLEVLRKANFAVKNNFSSVGEAEREALMKHYNKDTKPAAKAPAKEVKPKAQEQVQVKDAAPKKPAGEKNHHNGDSQRKSAPKSEGHNDRPARSERSTIDSIESMGRLVYSW